MTTCIPGSNCIDRTLCDTRGCYRRKYGDGSADINALMFKYNVMRLDYIYRGEAIRTQRATIEALRQERDFLLHQVKITFGSKPKPLDLP